MKVTFWNKFAQKLQETSQVKSIIAFPNAGFYHVIWNDGRDENLDTKDFTLISVEEEKE